MMAKVPDMLSQVVVRDDPRAQKCARLVQARIRGVQVRQRKDPTKPNTPRNVTKKREQEARAQMAESKRRDAAATKLQDMQRKKHGYIYNPMTQISTPNPQKVSWREVAATEDFGRPTNTADLAANMARTFAAEKVQAVARGRNVRSASRSRSRSERPKSAPATTPITSLAPEANIASDGDGVAAPVLEQAVAVSHLATNSAARTVALAPATATAKATLGEEEDSSNCAVS